MPREKLSGGSVIHHTTRECLLACSDAHHIAGQLLVDKIDREAINEAAFQLKRTARQLKKLAAGKGGE